MPDRILVINPNSTDGVTRAIDDAMTPLRITGEPAIDCMTLRDGPPGVESQSDADAVIAPLCRAIRGAEPETAAFVIACFSDPGLFSAREATAKPVLGIAECGTELAFERFRPNWRCHCEARLRGEAISTHRALRGPRLLPRGSSPRVAMTLELVAQPDRRPRQRRQIQKSSMAADG